MLSIENLTVDIKSKKRMLTVLSDINLKVNRGETLGIVGESGCGKSMTANAVMGLLKNNIKITNGAIMLDDLDLSKIKEFEYEKIRGSKISMIFQSSMSALNPLMKVGKQIEEAYEIHLKISKEDLKNKVIDLLADVGFKNPEETYGKFPHNLSGGQKQRVMIAMAIACDPELLIADEPTTALDATTQNKILKLIKNIQNRNNMAIILISHDITVINMACTHVAVMYAGKIVEYGRTEDIIKNPMHPYTEALIKAIPNTANKNNPLNVIEGFIPPVGERNYEACIFYDRCKYKSDKCLCNIEEATLENERRVACVMHK